MRPFIFEAKQVINKYLAKESLSRKYLTGAVFKKGTHEYFPLPIDEITNTFVGGKATLKKNTGY